MIQRPILLPNFFQQPDAGGAQVCAWNHYSEYLSSQLLEALFTLIYTSQLQPRIDWPSFCILAAEPLFSVDELPAAPQLA
jgi:hypothetical protein